MQSQPSSPTHNADIGSLDGGLEPSNTFLDLDSSTDDETSNIRTRATHLLKGIDIHSVWDGVPDHAALVHIDIAVEAEPDTRVTLLGLANDHVSSAVVKGIQKLSTPHSSEALQHRPSEPSIPFATQSISDRSASLTPAGEKNCPSIEDNVSSSRRRLFPVFRSTSSGWSISSSFTHFASPFEILSRVPSTESVRSLSCKTVQVHPKSKLPDPIERHEKSPLPFQKHAPSTEKANIFSFRDCEACNSLNVTPHRRRSGGLQQHFKVTKLPMRIRTTGKFLNKRYEMLSQSHTWPKKKVIKEPRHRYRPKVSSNPTVELCKLDRLAVVRTNSAFRQALIQKARTNKISNNNCKSPHDDKAPFSGPSPKFSPTALNNENQGQRVLSPPYDGSSFFISDTDESENEVRSAESSAAGLTFKPYQNTCFRNTSSSDSSPRSWLRKNTSSNRRWPWVESNNPKSYHSSTSATATGKLELHFANNVIAGIYRVEIEASVHLHRSEHERWQNFIIPGLLRSQEPSLLGFLNFRVMPSLGKAGKQPRIAPSPMQAQFDTSNLLNIVVNESSRLVGRFSLQSPLLVRLRLEEPVHEVTEWSGSILLCTSAAWSEKDGLRIKHHVSLKIERMNRDFFAKQIKYSLIIKNASLPALNLHFKPGEFSINLEKKDAQYEQKGCPAEVTITRHAQDLFHPLEMYFAERYQGRSTGKVSMPSFYPKSGEMISEKILIPEPPPPLVIEYQSTEQFTTWKRTDVSQGQGQITRFDRVKIPWLVPESLKDDVILEVKELNHVQFQSIEAPGDSSTSRGISNFIWNFGIKVDRVCGRDLSCRMSFDMQAGNNKRLLTIDSRNWVPDLAVVDGRICSRSTGEWREDENGNLVLFNISKVALGQVINVQVHWKEPKNSELETPKLEFFLPHIIGKSAVGGSLKCVIDGVTCALLNDGVTEETLCFSAHAEQVQARLPVLRPHHALRLSVPNVRLHTTSYITNYMTGARGERNSSDGERDALAGQNEREGEYTPCSRLDTNLNPIVASKPQHRRGDFLSFINYPLRLLTSVFHHVKRTFLLTCILQLALVPICQIWNPWTMTQICWRYSIQYLCCEFHPSFCALARGETTTNCDGSTAVMAEFHRHDTEDGAEAGNLSPAMKEPRNEQPMDEAAQVRDWIDRALGWKGDAS